MDLQVFGHKVKFLTIALVLSACTGPVMFQRQVEYLSPTPLPENVQAVSPASAASVGLAKFSAGDYGASVIYLQQATAASPDNAEVWLALAAAADRAGRFDISRPAYEKVLGLVGPVFEYQNNIGFSYILQGRHADAERALNAALTLKPNDETALNNLALLQRIKG